jgi:hypothetical protein
MGRNATGIRRVKHVNYVKANTKTNTKTKTEDKLVDSPIHGWLSVVTRTKGNKVERIRLRAKGEGESK